jgi:hypothetical protein
MMAGLPDFRARQLDLQQRLRRQLPRSIYRRRLERELRGLVAAELQLEVKSTPLPAPEPDPAELAPFHPTHWLQRWEDEQDNDR